MHYLNISYTVQNRFLANTVLYVLYAHSGTTLPFSPSTFSPFGSLLRYPSTVQYRQGFHQFPCFGLAQYYLTKGWWTLSLPLRTLCLPFKEKPHTLCRFPFFLRASRAKLTANCKWALDTLRMHSCCYTYFNVAWPLRGDGKRAP